MPASTLPHTSLNADLLSRLEQGFQAANASTHDHHNKMEVGRWQELLAQVGRELAMPLTAALERVSVLTSTGRIDRQGLNALHDEVDRVRQVGIWCQQISRLATGRVQQSHERVHLTNTVQSVLAYRARALQGKALHLTQSLQTVEVQIDASMLFGLLNAMVDWWLDSAQGTIELQIDTRTWPARARLISRFQHHATDAAVAVLPEAQTAALNTMHWHLLEQTAKSLGLSVERRIDSTHAHLTLEFPNTVHNLSTTVVDLAEGPNSEVDSVNAKPLAGSHVLVVSGRRDLRMQLNEATKDMGLIVDFVGSVREAAAFCEGGLPHAIVFEGALRTPQFDLLVAHLRQEVPEFVFVELLDEGSTFEISNVSATGMARVGREAIANALPSALVYELSRVM